NIEGTDWLLVVMPEKERTPGKTVAYLLPTAVVEAEARRTHREWLAGNPKTRGDNRTWNLWFGSNAPAPANNYAAEWAKYRLGTAVDAGGAVASRPVQTGNIKAEVESARRRIAEVAGIPIEAVKITINFEG